MKNQAMFWDKVADKYSRRSVPSEEVYKKKLEVTQGFFSADDKVVEIGCGTGTTALHHAPHVRKYHAMDFSPRMIEIANEKLNNTDLTNLEFEVGLFEENTFAPASVDAILALSLLHLLKDPEEMIKNVHKALKPNGIFVTSTGCIGDTMPFLKYVLPIGSFFGAIPFVKVLKISELEKMMEDVGFRVDYKWVPEGSVKTLFLICRKLED
ncbi:MAG: methyltransferase domain-containing protein [Alphaproteobacteria bacterium]|nr:methyltransferase domain-containing protein [Alphaproteobacteria bacterium]